jgi:hypothetical protein
MLGICTELSAVGINAGRSMDDNANDGLLITRLPAVLRFHGIHSKWEDHKEQWTAVADMFKQTRWLSSLQIDKFTLPNRKPNTRLHRIKFWSRFALISAITEMKYR